MQAPHQPSVKIYNAVYSSVQVYECMVRNVAVMRRRGDSYVNATQILKVAGVDKGRRTKILEKEILPGKHEIVQGGYGKYQGTWIPLERGRDVAQQYGVAPLLAPLFDFQPSTNSLAVPTLAPPSRPLSANPSASSFSTSPYPGALPPPPILPGSALRLLEQGRAQGLFTPSTTSLAISSSFTAATPPPAPSLKRNRSEADVDTTIDTPPILDQIRPSSTIPVPSDGPSPTKRPRNDTSQPASPRSSPKAAPVTVNISSTAVPAASKKPPSQSPRQPRLATKPSVPRNLDPTIPLKDTRRAAVIAAICQHDDPATVLNILREIASLPNQSHLSNPTSANAPQTFDIDTILDDYGHTALHIAASLSHITTVQTLISMGADAHRGNHLGETPLMRTVLSTHAYENQSLPSLLATGLSDSMLTLDTSRKSVLHHIVLVAGVKGRGVLSKYYLDQVFFHITKSDEWSGDFSRIIDLQDEHGDTALNVAARVGSRTLVRTLVDVGANKFLMNKLGLKPADFGIETDELLATNNSASDMISLLRPNPPLPIQKSQDVIASLTSMIQTLSTDFQSEIKTKQDALDVTQAHLRAATRELSEQRKQIGVWMNKCRELDLLSWRQRNLEQALVDEDEVDWTGRWTSPQDDTIDADGANGDPQVDGIDPDVIMNNGITDEDEDASADEDEEAALPTVMPPKYSNLKQSSAFRYRGPSSSILGVTVTLDNEPVVGPDIPLPDPSGDNAFKALIHLRRIHLFQSRIIEFIQDRLVALHGASAEKEYMCRKIVSLCTGVPMENVETMLGALVVAVESEGEPGWGNAAGFTSMNTGFGKDGGGPNVDIGRVSEFMQKVRDGII